MKRDYIDFQSRSSPVGFLITFRCYGSWLHGDRRGSFDRHHRVYGTPGLRPSGLRRKHDCQLMQQPPVKLNSRHRQIVDSAIRESCSIRGWQLWTLNVRTNHVHAVVSANKKPEAILSALKANATRAMKEGGVWTSELSPWSFGGSRKYLWDERSWPMRLSTFKVRRETRLIEGLVKASARVSTRSGSDGISTLVELSIGFCQGASLTFV